MKKRGLGRGLSDLGISELLSEIEQPAGSALQQELCHLPVEVLQPGRYQPRKVMDDDTLQELAESIRAQGIIQPIVVRPIDQGAYEIIAGERRWRAAQLAEKSEVPVIIKDVDDAAAIAMTLIENIQREDLNAIEEAESLRRLIDEFNLTHDQAAQAIGKSRAMVSNLLRLLNLNADVRYKVEQGDLEMGHARALLALEGEQQTQVAILIVEKELTVRATEALIHKLKNPKPATTPSAPDPNIQGLQNQLADKLGTKVAIRHRINGAGKVVIHYHSLDELEGILSHINT